MRADGPTAVILWAALVAGACEHGEPPTPAGSASVAKPEIAAFDAGWMTAAPPAARSASAATRAAPASPSGLAAASPPASAAVDPALLPQTRDSPQASGPAFAARVATLWDAVVRDTPEAATPFFFPVGAYQQVKDVADPSADWRNRLLAAYRHDIHALHERLGDAAERATLVGLDVPEARARWVEPGEEWNKIGYFRVFNSKLRYEVDGEARAFDVKSLISWRGEWFVVHLSAIK